MLPYASDTVAFAHVPPRIESVLVVPRGVLSENRPTTTAVMDA
jgi:hypothetical protein